MYSSRFSHFHMKKVRDMSLTPSLAATWFQFIWKYHLFQSYRQNGKRWWTSDLSSVLPFTLAEVQTEQQLMVWLRWPVSRVMDAQNSTHLQQNLHQAHGCLLFVKVETGCLSVIWCDTLISTGLPGSHNACVSCVCQGLLKSHLNSALFCIRTKQHEDKWHLENHLNQTNGFTLCRLINTWMSSSMPTHYFNTVKILRAVVSLW